MKIERNGKGFNVMQNNTIVLLNVTFDQARECLASNGNKDAAKPLVKHSSKNRGERLIEPEFAGEYEFKIRSMR